MDPTRSVRRLIGLLGASAMAACACLGTVTPRPAPVVDGGLQLSLSDSSVSLSPGGTHTFVATVSGASSGQSAGVNWSVQEGAAGGTIDANGKYTAPATEGTYHVVATSVADASMTASRRSASPRSARWGRTGGRSGTPG